MNGNSSELEEIKKNLYSSSLILKSSRQKNAVEKLALRVFNNDLKAIELMAEVLENHENEEIQNFAFSTLASLKSTVAINHFAQLWYRSRSSQLEKVLLSAGYIAIQPPELKVLTILKSGKISLLSQLNPAEVEIVLKFTKDQDPQIAQRAANILKNIKNQAAINRLIEIYVNNRSPEIKEIIINNQYIGTEPPVVNLFSVILTGKFKAINQASPEIFRIAIPLLKDSDPEIAQKTRNFLLHLPNQKLIDIFCNICFLNRDKEIEKILFEARYLPSSNLKCFPYSILKTEQDSAVEITNLRLMDEFIQLLRDNDQEIQKKAQKKLSNLKSQLEVNLFCQSWYNYQTPQLTSILREKSYLATEPEEIALATRLINGKLYDLFVLSDQQKIILKKFLYGHKTLSREELDFILKFREKLLVLLLNSLHNWQPELQQIMREKLSQLSEQDEKDLLIILWALSSDKTLEEIIIASKYYPSAEFPQLQFLTSILFKQEFTINEADPDFIFFLLKALKSNIKEVRQQATLLLKKLPANNLQGIFSQLFNLPNEEMFSSLNELGIAPEDKSQRALFFFITGNYKKFEEADPLPSRPLLWIAVQKSSVHMKNYFYNRVSPQVVARYLKNSLLEKGNHLYLSDLTPQEMAALIDILCNQENLTCYERIFPYFSLKNATFIFEHLEKNALPVPSALDKMMKVFSKYNLIPYHLGEHEISVDFLFFLKTGDILSTGRNEKHFYLWNIKKKKLVRHIEFPGDLITAADLSPSRKLLAIADNSGQIYLLTLPQLSIQKKIQKFSAPILTLVFSPDGKLLFSSNSNGNNLLYNILENNFYNVPQNINSNCAAFSICGQLYIGADSGLITIFDPEGKKIAGEFKAHENNISGIIFYGDKRLITCSFDKSIKIWDLETLQLEATLIGHSNWVIGLQLFQDYLISAGMDNHLIIWDLKEKRQLCKYDFGGDISALKIEQSILATGNIERKIFLSNLIFLLPFFKLKTDFSSLSDFLPAEIGKDITEFDIEPIDLKQPIISNEIISLYYN